ncbi:MAG: hypothetical protein QGH11_13570, partial [Pirellulaceae bacterium]|nr:hypothetical protein [Pirellulaceae bacterium]
MPTGVVAQRPLHEKIDELIQQDQFFGVKTALSSGQKCQNVHFGRHTKKRRPVKEKERFNAFGTF